MLVNRLVWKIGGEAGYGIQNAGMTVSKIFKELGLYVFATLEYPSLIRGGHNTFTVRADNDRITSEILPVDILVCLDEATLNLHKDELTKDGAIIYDNALNVKAKKIRKDIRLLPLPILEFSKQYGADFKVMMATFAIGATIKLLGISTQVAEQVITMQLSTKGQDVLNSNFEALNNGYNELKTAAFKIEMKPKKKREDLILIDGNTAIALGAIRSGCKYFSAYPMTPSTSIMEYVAKNQEKHNMIMHQAEDEISAINSCLGASYAGIRSMTATSGGGFALMNEALSLSGSSEMPIVIVLGQRPGPATGLPTRTEQGDLLYAVHGGHGEFPRIVMAPGDVTECFNMTLDAFNMADKYQIPIIILTDKHIAASVETTTEFKSDNYKIDRGELLLKVNTKLRLKEKFKRYAFTKTGVSPRTIPGVSNGMQCSIGDEHDEEGYIIEDAVGRKRMYEKRANKNKGIIKSLNNKCIEVFGNKNAKTAIISWGSNKGIILEALKSLKNCKLIQVKILHPFPGAELAKKVGRSKIIIVEQNGTSQLGQLIKQNTSLKISDYLLKYDGRAFTPEEIINHMRRKK
ncbi:2-oxoglutarate synthase subunit KorA [Candidatus Tiddalikarchaeum anstoanum]|nr:2-oxoglutarate synthase subunit KorA [Candidatus Tiddalikarchaeum anstoanum]